jgi:hypothetical protein
MASVCSKPPAYLALRLILFMYRVIVMNDHFADIANGKRNAAVKGRLNVGLSAEKLLINGVLFKTQFDRRKRATNGRLASVIDRMLMPAVRSVEV